MKYTLIVICCLLALVATEMPTVIVAPAIVQSTTITAIYPGKKQVQLWRIPDDRT